jgi:hypothetical protein
VAGKLGLDWKRAVHGSVEPAFQAIYDVTEPEVYLSDMTFGPVPDWLEKKRRGKNA